mmetsp:Transcript_43303/g.98524  ORF Transcript_43303/g.98524 Transcript_43303/m.98524 type:complete len:231 (+) Transcript_43303:361-1053(+)
MGGAGRGRRAWNAPGDSSGCRTAGDGGGVGGGGVGGGPRPAAGSARADHRSFRGVDFPGQDLRGQHSRPHYHVCEPARPCEERGADDPRPRRTRDHGDWLLGRERYQGWRDCQWFPGRRDLPYLDLRRHRNVVHHRHQVDHRDAGPRTESHVPQRHHAPQPLSNQPDHFDGIPRRGPLLLSCRRVHRRGSLERGAPSVNSYHARVFQGVAKSQFPLGSGFHKLPPLIRKG